MTQFGCLVAIITGIVSSNLLLVILLSPALPIVDENIWWTSEIGDNCNDVSLREFVVDVSYKIIDDLKWRLEHHRLQHHPIEGSANQYGTNLNFLKDIVNFWKDGYNWTERQAYLNRYPQFLTNVQGLDIHFIHVKSKLTTNKRVVPLLLLHGWPGSIIEFYDVIEILTTINKHTKDRNFALEVVVPNIPGFGFSKSATKPGLAIEQVAVLLKKLMNRLGYEKFYIQGGDMGALTLQTLSVLYPDSVLGFHTNFPVVYTPKSYFKSILGSLIPSLFIRAEHWDRAYPLVDKAIFMFQESGYLHIQATKPDSIGTALNESPVGLAAYFLEKFITGGNFSWIRDFDPQDINKMFSYTRLVDNLMYYWITGSAGTALRLYKETFGNALGSKSFALLRTPVQVPTIIFRAKYDLYMPDGILSDIYPNLLNLTDYDDVGHFAAFQNPELFSEDLLNAIVEFEQQHFDKYRECKIIDHRNITRYITTI